MGRSRKRGGGWGGSSAAERIVGEREEKRCEENTGAEASKAKKMMK